MRTIRSSIGFFVTAQLRVTAAIPVLMLSASPSIAAPPERAEAGTKLEEIVVTAQKREEKLFDVPISVAAYSGEELEKQQVLSIMDLQYVSSNLIVSESTDRGSGFFFMRGIGTQIQDRGLEQSVGVYVDGIYRGRPGGALADLMDVERVEVLRGPQTTLFGRNNIGGAISVVTKLPSFTSGGYGELSYGNYDTLQFRGSVTGPISDAVAYRVSIQHTSHGGYLDNLTPGKPDVDSTSAQSIRAQLLFNLSDKGSIRISGDWFHADDECCGVVFHFMSNTFLNGAFKGGTLPGTGTPGTAYPNNTAGQYFDPFDRKVAINNRNKTKMDDGGISVEANYDFGDVTLTMIGSHRIFDLNVNEDVDYTDSPQFNVQAYVDDQFPEDSAEFRLTNSQPGALDWIVGAYYFHQKLDERLAVTLAPTDGIESQTTTSVAGFGQLTFNVNDALSLTAGARYMTEKKQSDTIGLTPATLSVSASVEDSAWMGNATVGYKFSDEANVYAKYSRGFKSAAIPLTISSAAQKANPVLNPETADVFEIGGKFMLLDNRLSLNIALFDQKVKDLQVQSRLGDTLFYIFQNAAEISSWGTEIELNYRPTSNLSISAAVATLDAEYSNFSNAPLPTGTPGVVQDLTHQRPWRSPTLTFSGNVTYDTQIGNNWGMVARLGGRYAGEYTTDLANSPWFANPSTTVMDGSLEFSSGDSGWSVMVWGKNLTDEGIIRQGSVTVSGAGSHAWYLNNPRTYGVTVRKSF